MLTPYQFASNTPIAAIDLDGLEGKDAYLARQQTRSVINLLSNGDVEKQRELWDAYNHGEDMALATAGAAVLIFYTGGRAAPILESLFYSSAATVALNADKIAVGGSFIIGIFDEAGQMQVPGPFDDAGRATKMSISKAFEKVRGFSSKAQLKEVLSKVSGASGVDDALVGLRGSSVTGTKFKSGEAFDAASDLDLFIVSDKLFKQALDQGAKGKGGSLRVGETLKYFPELAKAEKEIVEEVGRKASIKIFSEEGFKKAIKE